MWIWLRAHHVQPDDYFWVGKGYVEFEKMFGRRPKLGLDSSTIGLEIRALFEEMDSAIIHFGEVHLSAATIACVIARVEERLTSQST